LDRFSEDLDFSLKVPDEEFDLTTYFPVLEKEVRAFGLNMDVMEKEKAKESNIRSAFLKGNTREHLLLFYAGDMAAGGVAANEVIKIKFEVDVNPPEYATYEHKYRMLPAPYEVNMYDMPSLFAGKIHAVICRGWKSRIKGRDLYDFIFYLSRGVSVNRMHLRQRLIQSGYITEDSDCSLEEIKDMLKKKFDNIDYSQAKRDVEPFIHDPSVLDVWCKEFFYQITEDLTAC